MNARSFAHRRMLFAVRRERFARNRMLSLRITGIAIKRCRAL